MTAQDDKLMNLARVIARDAMRRHPHDLRNQADEVESANYLAVAQAIKLCPSIVNDRPTYPPLARLHAYALLERELKTPRPPGTAHRQPEGQPKIKFPIRDDRRPMMAKVKIPKDEQGFVDWLETTEFVDKTGKVVTPKLAPDESDDPDGDRTGT